MLLKIHIYYIFLTVYILHCIFFFVTYCFFYSLCFLTPVKTKTKTKNKNQQKKQPLIATWAVQCLYSPNSNCKLFSIKESDEKSYILFIK